MKITFSINLYDFEGDLIEECILLHTGDNTILRLNDMKELDQVINNLKDIKKEIEEG